MYQALYRKWRPKLFDDVVGQSHITRTLKRQVMSGHLSHAYLFTGTRGTGKTTCAKLLAKAVNCLHPVEGNPCGECQACRGIEEGSILDVVEMDAASNNGVDQVRALRDEAVYSPAAVKRRVYIVDEVHMLSTGAFNALLKILEEPPEHVLFILATTELHKVPATILSRCQRFSFKRIQAADIQNRLLYIARAEGMDLSEDGAALLARLADGALRDALSLLDQCAAAGGRVDKDTVLDVLGLAGNTKTAHVMNYIRRGETAKALTELSELYAAGKDVGTVLSELSGLTRDLLLRTTVGGAVQGLMAGGYDEATLQYLAKGMTSQRLLHMLNVLQEAQAKLKSSANRRTDAELCIIRLCDPRLDGSVLSLSQRLSRLESMLASGQFPQGGTQRPFVPPPQSLGREESVPQEPVGEALSAEPEAIPVPAEPARPPAQEDRAGPEEPMPQRSGEMEEIFPPPVDQPPPAQEPSEELPPFPEEVPPPMEEPLFPAEPAPPPPIPASPPQRERRRGKRLSEGKSPQAGGDPRFWQLLEPALRETMGGMAKGMLSQGLVMGQYRPGLLCLYVPDRGTLKWLSGAKQKEAIEHAAALQAGRSVRLEVHMGEAPAPVMGEAPILEEAFPAHRPREETLPLFPEGDPLADLVSAAATEEGRGIIEIITEEESSSSHQEDTSSPKKE